MDQYDLQLMDADADGLNDGWEYFTVYPDEAAAVPPPTIVWPADIFDVAPGMISTVPIPYATAAQLGLGPADSIDGLVVFDNDLQGGPNWGGPGAQAGVDYALYTVPDGIVFHICKKILAFLTYRHFTSPLKNPLFLNTG